MGLPIVHFFLLGSLIPPKVHFWGSEGNEMSKLLHGIWSNFDVHL